MTQRKHSQSGHTLVEMIVVMAIALVVILASFQMLDETSRVTMFIETRNDLPIMAQRAVNQIQSALSQSTQVYDSDTAGTGPAYLAKLTIPTSAPVLTGSRLPRLNENGQFVPDQSGQVFTGNSLLIARQLSPLTISYAGGTKTLFADRYRFEYYYLTRKTNFAFAGSSVGYLDAMRARSKVFADYFQLRTITVTGPERKQINQALIAAGMTVAWEPGLAVNVAFFDVLPQETFAAAYTANTAAIDMSDVKSITPMINDARIFGKMSYSIAFRPSLTTTYAIPTPVPKYAFLGSEPLFPSGMEFMIVGTASTRRVLSRMAIMAHYRAREYSAQEASVVTAPGQ